MGRKPIYIFGYRYAGPKGLRRSPPTNWLASCVRGKMKGSHPSDPQGAFSAAARSCAKEGKP